MIDPIATAIGAIVNGSPDGIPIAAAAGLLTSIGPCVAPRYIALASLLQRPQRTRTVALFVSGMLLAYSVLGYGFGALAIVTRSASIVYVGLSAILIVSGSRMLLRKSACRHHDRPATGLRSSGAFSLGAASALSVSPCCTPVLIAISGLAGAGGSTASRFLVLAAFTIGHAAPLIVAGPIAAAVDRRLPRWHAGPAPAVVSGALMIGLGAYYGLLV